MKTDYSSIERVEEFKYLGTTSTNQSSSQEEIKSRLKIGNACYSSVQNLLSSRRGVHNVLVGKPEGKRPLGRPRHRWEDLQEVGGGFGDWMELAQDREKWRALVSTVMNLRVP
jgi:hypothetical protein